jgi:hypothetical protein
VQLDEVAALDVPVRLLQLRIEVKGVRQPRVQELDELLALVVCDVDPSFERAARLSCHDVLPAGLLLLGALGY